MLDLDKIHGMVVDGICASAAVDSSGEVLDIRGADCSDMYNNTCPINYEHKNPDDPGNSALDIVGRIVYGKKLYSLDDCETSRQKEFFEKVKLPCIYFIGVLADEAGHLGAQSAAALIRNDVANGFVPLCRWSVEGSTLETADSGHKLVRSVVRRVALTLKPCNRSVQTGILADPAAPPKFEVKTKVDKPTEDLLAGLAEKLTAKSTFKSEADGLMYRKLGSSWEDAYDPCVKALEAGMPTGAPSTLTGGAALQREDISERARRIHDVTNRAKSVVRDWWGSGGKDDIRTVLKMQLPEVSPEFIERFSSVVDDYRLKNAGKGMLKVEDLLDFSSLEKRAKAKPPEELPVQDNVEPEGGGDTDFDTEALEAKAGKTQLPPPSKYLEAHRHLPGPLPTPTSRARAYFDPDKGVLHTQLGSYPMAIPSDAMYRAILESPAVQRPHEEAMRHWLHLHKLLAAGKLPPEVMMHAALFSGQSSSEKVPMQEIGFSHLQDQIARGADPSRPGGVGKHHIAAYKQGILGNSGLPEFEREHWAGPGGDATRVGPDSVTGKPEGAQASMMYPTQKVDNILSYHELHPDLVRLLGQHGVDARTIANKLIQQKQDARKYAGVAARKEKGPLGVRQPSFQEATGTSRVPGFAPKTIRYMLGMMGAGNAHVPDTHFIRHVFGLPTDSQVRDETEAELGRPLGPGEKPYAPNAHLKNVMWYGPGAGHIGDAIDRFYGAHHPAVAMVRDRYGKQLAGPDQAIFPGFWAHWLSIAPHEGQQGIANYASNAETNHSVYWRAVEHVLQHYGLNEDLGKGEVGLHDAGSAPEGIRALPLHMRTFLAQKSMEGLLGETPASLFYAQKLLPMLLAAKLGVTTSAPAAAAAVAKAEALAVNLGALTQALRKAEEDQQAGVETYQGQRVKPGYLHMASPHPKTGEQRFVVLGATPREFVGHWPSSPEKLESVHIDDSLEGLPPYHVLAWPKPAESKSFVIQAEHGIPEVTHHPEQKRLLHGLRTETRASAPAHAIGRGIKGVHENAFSRPGDAFWTQGPAGQPVFVKRSLDTNTKDFDEARREAAYYNLGKEYFGLGDYLTPTAAYTHPITGQNYSVSEGVSDAEHWDEKSEAHRAVLAGLHGAGEADKLQLMNGIMGNTDRHGHNYVFSKAARGGLKLIDHGRTLFHSENRGFRPAAYMWHHLDPRNPFMHSAVPVHPLAQQWLHGLPTAGIVAAAAASGMSSAYQLELLERLTTAKAVLRANPSATYNDIGDGIYRVNEVSRRLRADASSAAQAAPAVPPVPETQPARKLRGDAHAK
jgi:hypothetical protein